MDQKDDLKSHLFDPNTPYMLPHTKESFSFFALYIS